MPRSKPFSGKAKKQQLKNKKQQNIKSKNLNFDSTDALFANIEENEEKIAKEIEKEELKKGKNPLGKENQTRIKNGTTSKPPSKNSKNQNSNLFSSDDDGGDLNHPNNDDSEHDLKNLTKTVENPQIFHSNYKDIESIQNSFGRFFLKLEKLTKAEVEERKIQARSKIYNINSAGSGFNFFKSKIIWPDFPKRPEWSAGMSQSALETSESNYFIKFINSISSHVGKQEDDINTTNNTTTMALNKFEHNLETWRQLWRVIEKSNVIAIVADIRFPNLTLADSLLNYLKNIKKPVILLLNKSDLVPPKVAADFYKFYTTDPFYKSVIDKVILFTSPKRELKLSKKNFNFIKDKYHLGPGDLQKYLREKLKFDISGWKEADINQARLAEKVQRDDSHSNSTTKNETGTGCFDLEANRQQSNQCNLGFLGFPNVGKSSVMNRLVGKKITRISATPGATKYFQTYFPEGSKNIQLIDCPGLVFPAIGISFSEQILAGSYPISQVQEPYTTIGELIHTTPLLKQLNLFKINSGPIFNNNNNNNNNNNTQTQQAVLNSSDYFNYDFSKITAWQVCELYSQQKGFFAGKGGGSFDCYKAANQILRRVLIGNFDVFTVYEELQSIEESTGSSDESLDDNKKDDLQLVTYLQSLRDLEDEFLKESAW